MLRRPLPTDSANMVESGKFFDLGKIDDHFLEFPDRTHNAKLVPTNECFHVSRKIKKHVSQ